MARGALPRPGSGASSRCARRAGRPSGFTLLEVMVATAILGLTLTVILSAEGGLAASNKSTSNFGLATALARCKMTEAEDKLLRYGFPMVDDLQLDQTCCNDEEVVGFKCDMRTELILMPNPPTSGLDGGALSLSSTAASPSALLSSVVPTDMGSLAALGMDGGLANLAPEAGLGTLGLEGGLAGLDGSISLAPLMGTQMGGSGAGTQGLLQMVMGFVYPFIKPMMEASIRRVTVTVRWNEGIRPKEFSIIQYVTNPSNGGFGPSSGDAGTGTGGRSGSSSGQGGPPGGASPVGGIQNPTGGANMR